MRTTSTSIARLGKAFLLIAAAFTANPTAKADCTYEKNLTGQEFGVGVMLTWATSTETNNSVFTVERSDNGIDFQQVGTVRGAGNSRKMKAYNFLDAAANGQKIYYRLKQVDNDGTASHTDPISVKKVMENQMVVVKMSSESSNKGFEVTIDAMTEGELTCLVKNTQNQTVMQRTQRLINGLNTVAIDMKGLAEGIYKLVLVRDKEEETLVLRKTREDMDSNSNVASDRKAKPAKN